jgi:glucosylceramidase
MTMSCTKDIVQLSVEVYETSADGNNLTKLEDFSASVNQEEIIQINLFPEQKRQTISGFGGSFTEASA